MSQKTIVLFLTKNEEKTVASEISKVQDLFQANGIESYQIVLCDDSTDRTRAIAANLGCQIIDGGGKGLGRAFYNATQKLKNEDFGCLITLDSDGQAHIGDVLRFQNLVLEDHYDLVTASRFLNRQSEEVKYKYPMINRIGVFFLS